MNRWKLNGANELTKSDGSNSYVQDARNPKFCNCCQNLFRSSAFKFKTYNYIGEFHSRLVSAAALIHHILFILVHLTMTDSPELQRCGMENINVT